MLDETKLFDFINSVVPQCRSCILQYSRSYCYLCVSSCAYHYHGRHPGSQQASCNSVVTRVLGSMQVHHETVFGASSCGTNVYNQHGYFWFPIQSTH